MDRANVAREDNFFPDDEAMYRVLCCIGLEGGFIKAVDIASLADAIWVIDAITEVRYVSATAACLEHGFLRVITEQDRRVDAERWINEPNQALGETPYLVGYLEFIPRGWKTFTQQQKKRYGVSLETHYAGSLRCIWNSPGRVSILSISEDTLVRELTNVRAGTDTLKASALQEPHTLGGVIGPYPIGQ